MPLHKRVSHAVLQSRITVVEARIRSCGTLDCLEKAGLKVQRLEADVTAASAGARLVMQILNGEITGFGRYSELVRSTKASDIAAVERLSKEETARWLDLGVQLGRIATLKRLLQVIHYQTTITSRKSKLDI